MTGVTSHHSQQLAGDVQSNAVLDISYSEQDLADTIQRFKSAVRNVLESTGVKDKGIKVAEAEQIAKDFTSGRRGFVLELQQQPKAEKKVYQAVRASRFVAETPSDNPCAHVRLCRRN